METLNQLGILLVLLFVVMGVGAAIMGIVYLVKRLNKRRESGD